MPNIPMDKKLNSFSQCLSFYTNIGFWLFSEANQWKLNGNQLKINANQWEDHRKLTLRKRVELFIYRYVWHHNFLVNHSICMILDAQKSRDCPLSNGSKIIDFHRGKIFLRTPWKKCWFNYGAQFTSPLSIQSERNFIWERLCGHGGCKRKCVYDSLDVFSRTGKSHFVTLSG